MATSNAPLQVAYLRVADRAIDAADKLTLDETREYAAFHGYHAFESLGGAVSAHFGEQIPRGHGSKITSFSELAKKFGTRLTRRVAELAIELNSLRNLMLYPEELPHKYIKLPEQRMTKAAAGRISGRVRTLIDDTKKQL